MTALTQQQRKAEWVEMMQSAYMNRPTHDGAMEAALAAVLPIIRARVLEEVEAALTYDAHSGEGWSFKEAEEPVKWKDIAWAARRRVRALAKEAGHAG
ncbi:hypothetical protein [Ancylobacter oerskovii]|uniref:Phage protein n=1 Tax=Ancylobacter oerskovii TaxID=459519 RepID=A0ABW4Z1U7_9HYPH|nr:hypothetical protein [Ancylobacter oerskovii]MBS7545066.1 hypothetical protein [Ancylobacter oerskovii]